MKSHVITAIIPGCGQWNLRMSKRGVKDENAQKACFSGWLCVTEWRSGSGGIRKNRLNRKKWKLQLGSALTAVSFCPRTKTCAALPNFIINSTTFVVCFLAAPAPEVRRLGWVLPSSLPSSSPAMSKCLQEKPWRPWPLVAPELAGTKNVLVLISCDFNANPMINKRSTRDFWALRAVSTECHSPLQARGKVGSSTSSWEGDIQQLWHWAHREHCFHSAPHPLHRRGEHGWKVWLCIAKVALDLCTQPGTFHTYYPDRRDDRRDYQWERTISTKQEKCTIAPSAFSLQNKGTVPQKVWEWHCLAPLPWQLVVSAKEKRNISNISAEVESSPLNSSSHA